ncbi:GIY-YIG nuclease family protein [bacterium]|nr:GIY-YIG nuclease family protein [bacterium]
MSEKHFVYILETERGTLYCGYTDNVEKRFLKHQSGNGGKYTRANKPIKIAYTKEFSTKSDALKEEYRIKHKLNRKQKLELIAQYQHSH